MNIVSGISKPLIAFVLLLCSQQLYAFDYFAGFDVGYNRVKIADERFGPVSVRVRGGALFWRGVGVEVNLSTGVSDAEKAGLTLELPLIASIYARFQTPYETGLKAYLLLGVTTVELEGSQVNNGFPGRERFSGPSIALGLLEPLSFIQNTALSLEVSGHFVDSDIDMTNFSLGLQYEF